MMVTDSRYEDLRDRVRTLESDNEGERLVNLRLLEQQQRLTAELSTVRGAVDALSVQVNKLADDMSVVKATLVRHGRALDVLGQDIRQLRAGQDTMSARLDTMSARLDRLWEESAARHAEMMAAIASLRPA
jgi:chromosome segregation ATPase